MVVLSIGGCAVGSSSRRPPVSGQVKDQASRPVPNIRVLIWPDGKDPEAFDTPACSVSSAADGFWSCPGLISRTLSTNDNLGADVATFKPNRRYRIRVEAPGFDNAEGDFSYNRKFEPFVIIVSDAASVGGVDYFESDDPSAENGPVIIVR